MGFKFLGKDKNDNLYDYIDFLFKEKSKQLKIKSMAISHAIDLIARTISKCEIKTYKDNKAVKEELYYILNIRPNKNEVATPFFYNAICKLLDSENGALLINQGSQLFLANSFDVTKEIIKEKTYKNIKLMDPDDNSNEIEFIKTFKSSQIMHLRLGNLKMKECLDNFYNEFGTTLELASNYYRTKKIKKYRLTPPGGQPTLKDPSTGEEVSYEDYKKKITNGLFDDRDTVILLSEQFKLEEIGDNSNCTSNDYRDLLKQWSDEVANAFNIPLDIFYGNKTDKSTSTNDFITFAINPIISIIQDEMNAKLITKENYLKGDRIVINKLNIKHFDIFDVASGLDKLFSDGFSHNDLLEFLDIPTLDEDWANKHYVTKNYSNVESEGGE